MVMTDTTKSAGGFEGGEGAVDQIEGETVDMAKRAYVAQVFFIV